MQHGANKIAFRLLEHAVLFTVGLLCNDLTCGLIFTNRHTHRHARPAAGLSLIVIT